MSQLIHILKYKLIMFLRFEKKLNLSEIIKNFGSSLIYIGFSIGTFYFTKYLIWFLLTKIKIGLFLLHEFMSMILFIFFLSVNIGNIIVSYSTLYKSNELSFLIIRPLKSLQIFLIKFLDNFFYSSSTLILIIISVLLGYSFYFKLSLLSTLYFLLFNFLPYIFSAGCMGVIILLLVLKLSSKISLRKLIVIISVVYLIIVYMFFKTQSPLTLVNSIMKYYPFENRDMFISEIIHPILNYLPNHWLSESAYWLVKNNFAESLILSCYQISLSLLLFILALFLGKYLYFGTLFSVIKYKKENSFFYKIQNRILNFSRLTFRNPYTETIIKKDILLFIREPSQIFHFFILLFLVITFAISINKIKYADFGNYLLQTSIYLSIMLFNFLLVSTFSLRFIFPIISLEGQAYWKIKSAPINSKILSIRKIISLYLIILVISLCLNIISNYKFGLIITIFTTLVTAFSSTTIIMINFGMGGLFVNFKEKNPVRIASSRGASLSFLLNIFFLLIIISLFINSISKFFLSRNLNKNFNYFLLVYPSIAILIISIILSLVSFRAGIKALEKDFT